MYVRGVCVVIFLPPPLPVRQVISFALTSAFFHGAMLLWLGCFPCAGRRLHNQYFPPEDYDRLTGNPETGRLTMNSFFWTAAQHH